MLFTSVVIDSNSFAHSMVYREAAADILCGCILLNYITWPLLSAPMPIAPHQVILRLHWLLHGLPGMSFFPPSYTLTFLFANIFPQLTVSGGLVNYIL